MVFDKTTPLPSVNLTLCHCYYHFMTIERYLPLGNCESKTNMVSYGCMGENGLEISPRDGHGLDSEQALSGAVRQSRG